jgi:hypothetical protein
MSDRVQYDVRWVRSADVQWQIGTERQTDNDFLLEIDQGPYGVCLTEETARKLLDSLQEYFSRG